MVFSELLFYFCSVSASDKLASPLGNLPANSKVNSKVNSRPTTIYRLASPFYAFWIFQKALPLHYFEYLQVKCMFLIGFSFPSFIYINIPIILFTLRENEKLKIELVNSITTATLELAEIF